MGLRGPQPQLQLRSEPLHDLTPPDWLGEAAKSYWHRHAPQLVDNQLLTQQTADNFALVADLWERLQEFRGQATTRSYLDLLKSYHSMSKPYRMWPTEKPNVKEDRHQDKPEFEFN